MTTKENTSSIARPCAVCIFLRQKCDDDCIFAPLFPPTDAKRFENIASIYGADNVSKLLTTIPESNRKDAVDLHRKLANYLILDKYYGYCKCVSELKAQEYASKFSRTILPAYLAQQVSRNQDPDHLSSDTVMPDNSQPMIGVSAGVGSVYSPPQSQPGRQMSKQVASAEHEGKLVIGNRHLPLAYNSRLIIGAASSQSSRQPQQPRQMAKDADKKVASSANKGKLVIGNRPQLLPDNSQSMIGVSAGVASVQSPQPLTPQQNSRDKGKQEALTAHEGKLVIGNRPQLLPGQQQERQMAPIASTNRGQLILRDPQTHEHLADQQQSSVMPLIDQMSWADMYHLLTPEDQHQLGQISSVNTGQMQIREPQQQMSFADMGQFLSREPEQHEYPRIGYQQQLDQTSSVNTGQQLSRTPQLDGYMRIDDQHQMAKMSSADISQLLSRESQQHASTSQMFIMEPQPDGVIRIDDQQKMAKMSPADTGPVLSRKPQQHGFTRFNTVFHDQQYSLLQSQQLRQQNQKPYFPPDYQDTALNRQMTLQRQQNQQLQQNQQPDLPPVYQDTEPNCPMVLQRQLNQQLQLHSDPHLRSQMMIQRQQHQQSHPQEKYSKPALDQQPRSRSDKEKGNVPFRKDRDSQL